MQIIIYKRRSGEANPKPCLTTELVCASDDMLVVQSPQQITEGFDDMYFVDIGTAADDYTMVHFDHNNEPKPPFTLVGRLVARQR